MAFWSEKNVEPKRKFRWLLYWTGVPQFVVKTVKKPSFNVETTAHQFLNYEFHYPGRVKWNPIEISLVDPIQPDSTKSLYRILQSSGYVMPDEYNENIAETISKEKMVDALGTEIHLVQLDADGVKPIETWIIKNPLITSATFDSLDYSSNDMLNITVGITYDYAYIQGLKKKDKSPKNLWDVNKPHLGESFKGDNSG
jgi:hypothetical protein